MVLNNETISLSVPAGGYAISVIEINRSIKGRLSRFRQPSFLYTNILFSHLTNLTSKTSTEPE
jgi:hypothetical protein